MATTTSGALFEVIITLIWACLLVPSAGNNRLFKALFFDKSVLVDIAASASLSFCPGLLEAIQATAPPTLSWWKSLPDDHRGQWGVYALVFEKKGCEPYIYTGSATDSRRGVTARWAVYDKHNLYLREDTYGLPSGVLWAFQNGYKITHKGLLVTTPIPGAINVPAFRLLFLAMEATFCFYFWTMRSRTKDYGMASCCPWPMDAFTYGGLCSHSALHDGVKGNFELTPQQLAVLDADVRTRRNAISVAYRAKSMAVVPDRRLGLERGYGAIYRDKNRDAYNARQRAFTAADPAAARARKALSRANIIASGKHRCQDCMKNFGSPSALAKHKTYGPHLDKVAAST